MLQIHERVIIFETGIFSIFSTSCIIYPTFKFKNLQFSLQFEKLFQNAAYIVHKKMLEK